MQFSSVINNAVKLVKKNSPEILTAMGVVGVATTAVLTAKASFKAKDILEEDRALKGPNMTATKDQVKLVWKCYIPPALAGMVTVSCIVGARNASSAKTTAAVAAYSLTEKAFSEYRDKVVEQIGANKESAIREKIVHEKLAQNPVKSSEVVFIGKGDVLCCDMHTRRYFRSDMEALRRAENTINAKMLSEMYVSLNEFYREIGLRGTSSGDEFGWDNDKLLKLDFTPVLGDNDEPCIAIEFNYLKPL